MADTMKTYHDKLQQKDLLPPNDPKWQEAQQTVLDQISEQQKFVDNNSELHTPLTYAQIANALISFKNKMATDLNGLPYELWKALHK
ncbi:hypothetical protein HD554DRAFT_2086409 [Boletus coccyginus]|nr:hypothetical protein HD554DRAFT_2086409 [Boletus coccyginus]